MPKMKTHKGAKRRFHVSGTGLVMRTKGPKSHFRRKTAKRVKRLFGAKVQLDSPTFSRQIKHALGGSRRAS
jgi:large subunit ribosomal protein L35